MSRVLAAVLGETSCPRQRLCSIRRILPSKSTCFHFRPSTSPNLVPVRATQSKNARRPSALRSECSATEQQTKWVSRTYRLLVCVYSELATEQSSRCPPRVTGSPARLKADCGRSLLRARLPALSVKTSRRAMGRSPQCEGRRTQARYAAPGQSHSFFLWTALHLCAASKVSTKHPQKLSGSSRSLRAHGASNGGAL